MNVVLFFFCSLLVGLSHQAPVLIAVSGNCSLVTIDPATAKYTVVANFVDCPEYPSDSISAAGVDVSLQEYYVQMGYDETRDAIYTFSLKTAKLLGTYVLPSNPLNPRWDSGLKKFIGMEFDSIVAYDHKSYEQVVALKPTMWGIQGDSAALNAQTHMFYYYNLTTTGANIVTVDVVGKKIVSSVALDKSGADDVQYIWYNYPNSPGLMGIIGWESIDVIDTKTGTTHAYGPISYDCYQTGVFDPVNQRMTFLGTDGKDKSYLVTVQNNKVIYAPVLNMDLSDLPGGLVYY